MDAAAQRADPAHYTRCYCEENVYLLLQQLAAETGPASEQAVALFITSSGEARGRRGGRRARVGGERTTALCIRGLASGG
jgi:hypothetical protein